VLVDSYFYCCSFGWYVFPDHVDEREGISGYGCLGKNGLPEAVEEMEKGKEVYKAWDSNSATESNGCNPVLKSGCGVKDIEEKNDQTGL